MIEGIEVRSTMLNNGRIDNWLLITTEKEIRQYCISEEFAALLMTKLFDLSDHIPT